MGFVSLTKRMDVEWGLEGVRCHKDNLLLSLPGVNSFEVGMELFYLEHHVFPDEMLLQRNLPGEEHLLPVGGSFGHIFVRPINPPNKSFDLSLGESHKINFLS